LKNTWGSQGGAQQQVASQPAPAQSRAQPTTPTTTGSGGIGGATESCQLMYASFFGKNIAASENQIVEGK
jgi:hypothetical protein